MAVIKIQCSNCNVDTIHEVHSEYKDRYECSYDPSEIKNRTHYIIQCRGCSTTSYLREEWEENTNESEAVTNDVRQYQFPNITDDFSSYEYLTDEEENYLPSRIYDFYLELKGALHNDCLTLATIGLRMLTEAICKDCLKDSAKKSLSNLIEELLSGHHITKNELAIFQTLRLMGNKSAHEVKAESETVLESGIYAVNHLMRTVYVMPKTTKPLRRLYNKWN